MLSATFKKALSCALLTVLPLLTTSIHATTVERLSLFLYDGTNAYEDRRIGSPQNNLPATTITAQFSTTPNAQNEPTWEWKLKNISGTSLNNLRATVLIDVDISPEDNTFHNEHGSLMGLAAPADHIAADKWEISELGYLNGDLLQRAATGNLNNQSYQDATTADDTAMALSINIGTLNNDQELTITATLTDNGTVGLKQKDAHNNTQASFQAYAKPGPIAPRAMETVDYAVTKTTSTPNADVGDSVEYTITITNNGQEDGTGVTLTDTVPSAINVITWGCVASGAASCATAGGSGNIISLDGQVPVGENLTITINGTALSAGQITNTATITPTDPATTTDSDSNNDTSNASISITAVAGTTPHPIPTNTSIALIALMLLLAGGLAVRIRKTRKLPLLCALILTFGLTLNTNDAEAIFLNGDFEAGDFSNWATGYGLNYGLSGSHPFRAEDVNISNGGVELLEIVGHTFDPRAPQLTLPRQGNFTAKVNDESNNYHLNYISQKDTLTEADRDPVNGKLHVRFTYAAVLQDPNHSARQQPYFYVQLTDLTTDEVLYYDFAYSNQPGRVFFTTQYSGTWRSTPFIDVDMEVPDTSLGHELEVRVLAADCAQGGHGGYVYVDAFGAHAIPPQGGCLGNLTARGKPGAVQLVWSDNGAVKYRIYRATALEGPYVSLGETDSRHSTWLDRTVETDQTYYYSVRPLDSDGAELCSSGEVIGVAPEHWSSGNTFNRPPYFTSTPVETGVIQTAYTHTITAVDADNDTLTYSLIYGPTSMTVDPSTGEIDWQPTETGFYRVNIAVEDGNGHIANQAFTIEIIDSNQAPVIGNPLSTTIPDNVALSHDLQASDPDGDSLVYSIGSQANGLTVSTRGVVNWSSPQPGFYPITIVVADTRGAKTQQQIVLEVQAFPKIVSTPPTNGKTNVLYSYQAQAQKANSTDTLKYSLAQAPSGMTIIQDSGLIQWTPDTVGSYSVTVQAVDLDGNVGEQTFTITITSQTPVITSTPQTSGIAGTTYEYQIEASDPDGDPLTYSLSSSAPNGMSVSVSGKVEWAIPSGTEGPRFKYEAQRG